MPPKKNLKLLDDEAECFQDESEDESDSDEDDSLDGFIVADGELSDSHYDDQPAAPKVVKKRGRPPGKAGAAKTKAESFKPPGSSAYPVNDFSLTITKTGGDVGLDALDHIAAFIEQHCLKGGVATEVGHRAFNFHLQGIFRVHWPTTKEYVQHLQKIVKGVLPDRGKQYKVLVKPFGVNQHFSAMVGYITKDQGQSHYQIRTHHISRQELSYGRRDHDAMLTSFDDAKKIVNFKNFFNECYKFNMRCMHPAVVPIHYALLYMIQSGTYILCPDFVSSYKKIDLSEALILWGMTHKPSETRIEDVLKLIFQPLSYGRKTSQRYFVAGLHRLDMEESERMVPASPISTDEGPGPVGTPARVNSLLAIARSGTSAALQRTVQTQPEFLPLPRDDSEEEASSYYISNSPTSPDEVEVPPVYANTCPAHLDDMLHIVRELRRVRREAMFDSRLDTAEIVTPATQEKSSSSNERNFTVTNLSDLL